MSDYKFVRSLAKTWDDLTHPSKSPDWFSLGGVDHENTLWVISWSVWPTVVVLASINGDEEALGSASDWARDAIRSIDVATTTE